MNFDDETIKNDKLFLISSLGHVGDHYLSWLPKAFNMHPEILALLAHEEFRSTHFKEKIATKRAGPEEFCEFLLDISVGYEAVGDFFSYNVKELSKVAIGSTFEGIVANVYRNPVIWLAWYCKWYTSATRSAKARAASANWGWLTVNKNFLSEKLNVVVHEENLDKWSLALGLEQLNSIEVEFNTLPLNYRLEDLISHREDFEDFFLAVTQNRLTLSGGLVNNMFLQLDRLSNREAELITDENTVIASLEEWQIDWFQKIVSDKSKQLYHELGYKLPSIKKSLYFKEIEQNPGPEIYVSTTFNSGANLINKIIHRLTGKVAVGPKFVSQESENSIYLDMAASPDCIDIRQGQFFSWHQIISSDVAALLSDKSIRPVFLCRNIFDIINALHHALYFGHHLKSDFWTRFKKFSPEERLNLIIVGFNVDGFLWHGADYICSMIASFFDYEEQGRPCLLISYEQLIGCEAESIKALAKTLGLEPTDELVSNICSGMSNLLMDQDLTFEADLDSSQCEWQPYQVTMVNNALFKHRLTNIRKNPLISEVIKKTVTVDAS